MDDPHDRNPKLITRFRNCRVLKGGQLILDDVWVGDGRVIDPMELFFKSKREPDIIYECHGLVASPGFIDLQVNGALGWDFSSFTNPSDVEKGLSEVSKLLLTHGVTAYCPTVVTSSKEYYNEILPLIKRREGGAHGAAILGVHAEGPFINPHKKGAHKEEHIIATDISPHTVLNTYGSLDNISIITLAPELSGCLETLPWLTRDKGIIVSLGHSMSNLQTAVEAFKVGGASLITHLFNAMLPFHHRDPGIVGLLTSLQVNKQVYYGLISDGYHTHQTVQRIAHHANPKGVVLVTDALPILCMDSGHYQLGEIEIVKSGNKAVIAGTDNLAGGIASMIECVEGFANSTACGLGAALEAASLHPARSLDEETQKRKGRLDVGADADIVFLLRTSSDTNDIKLDMTNSDTSGIKLDMTSSDTSGIKLEVIATVIGGEIVYQSLDREELRLERIK